MAKSEVDTKKVFKNKGTCSETFYFITDREFGHHNEEHEKASEVFAGGILQSGQQCGFVFGTVMATGEEAYRRCDGDCDKAIGLAILAAQPIMESFKKDAGSVDCYGITKTDFSKKLQFAKFLVFQTRSCFNLAEKCTPGALKAAREGVELDISDIPGHPKSCASELVKLRGGTEEPSKWTITSAPSCSTR